MTTSLSVCSVMRAGNGEGTGEIAKIISIFHSREGSGEAVFIRKAQPEYLSDTEIALFDWHPKWSDRTMRIEYSGAHEEWHHMITLEGSRFSVMDHDHSRYTPWVAYRATCTRS